MACRCPPPRSQCQSTPTVSDTVSNTAKKRSPCPGRVHFRHALHSTAGWSLCLVSVPSVTVHSLRGACVCAERRHQHSLRRQPLAIRRFAISSSAFDLACFIALLSRTPDSIIKLSQRLNRLYFERLCRLCASGLTSSLSLPCAGLRARADEHAPQQTPVAGHLLGANGRRFRIIFPPSASDFQRHRKKANDGRATPRTPRTRQAYLDSIGALD